jgi:hypothetical protein
LDSPVYEPDEEHATAQVLNAKERMDPGLVNARRVRGDGEVCALFDAGSLQWLNVEDSKKSVGMS